jgi:hypothetical protein
VLVQGLDGQAQACADADVNRAVGDEVPSLWRLRLRYWPAGRQRESEEREKTTAMERPQIERHG